MFASVLVVVCLLSLFCFSFFLLFWYFCWYWVRLLCCIYVFVLLDLILLSYRTCFMVFLLWFFLDFVSSDYIGVYMGKPWRKIPDTLASFLLFGLSCFMHLARMVYMAFPLLGSLVVVA